MPKDDKKFTITLDLMELRAIVNVLYENMLMHDLLYSTYAVKNTKTEHMEKVWQKLFAMLYEAKYKQEDKCGST